MNLAQRSAMEFHATQTIEVRIHVRKRGTQIDRIHSCWPSSSALEEVMKFKSQIVNCAMVAVAGSVMVFPPAMIAQNHVVSPGQIQNDITSSSSVRQRNEQELRGFLARKEIQKAMKSEGVNPQQVTNAVSQLNDADLASLTARTQKAQHDFAAGTIGLGIFTLIGIVVVAIILIAIFA